MTPEGGTTGVNLGWTRAYGGRKASSFRNLDRMDFPRFNLLGSPVA